VGGARGLERERPCVRVTPRFCSFRDTPAPSLVLGQKVSPCAPSAPPPRPIPPRIDPPSGRPGPPSASRARSKGGPRGWRGLGRGREREHRTTRRAAGRRPHRSKGHARGPPTPRRRAASGPARPHRRTPGRIGGRSPPGVGVRGPSRAGRPPPRVSLAAACHLWPAAPWRAVSAGRPGHGRALSPPPNGQPTPCVWPGVGGRVGGAGGPRRQDTPPEARGAFFGAPPSISLLALPPLHPRPASPPHADHPDPVHPRAAHACCLPVDANTGPGPSLHFFACEPKSKARAGR